MIISEFLSLILSLGIFIIFYSLMHILVYKSRIHKSVKEPLDILIFGTGLVIYLFFFYMVKDLNYSKLSKETLVLLSLFLSIVIFSISYLIAFYVHKIDKIYHFKINHLRKKEIILINLSMLILATILGVYFGFLILVLYKLFFV